MKVVVANIAKSIQIKELLNRTAKQMVHREPLVFQLGQKSFAALLKYGVAVYWNVSEKQKLAFDERIAPFLVDSYQAVEVDEPEIVLREKKQGVYEGKICLKAVDVETAALVSLVLGRAL
ncbi:MAG: hypothetical protein U1C97_02575, partial [Candidatus Gracilibacteria bacterium]|nr:hypothetical protein [Candidatus Gracilibacteria bacterium]